MVGCHQKSVVCLPTPARPALLAALAMVLGHVVSLAVFGQQPMLPPYKTGFPLKFPGEGTAVNSQPAIADLGLTPGVKSIILGTRNGKLFVIKDNGDGTWGAHTPMGQPGWPQTLPSHIASSPAIGDLDNPPDGIPEIVVGYGSTFEPSLAGGVRAYDREGNMLWQVDTMDVDPGNGLPDPVQPTPAIGDVDGDGRVEVAFASFDHRVYLVDGETGANEAGWPQHVRDTVFSSPAFHDIDGGGIPEIIIGTDAHAEGPPFNTPDGGCLRVFRFDGTALAGFPICIDQVIASSVAVGDIDGDGFPEIVHGTGGFWPGGTHQIYAWNCDGTSVAGWPIAIDGQASTSPALADVDGNGDLEIVIADDNSGPSGTFHISVFNGDGTKLWDAVPKDFFGGTLNAGEPLVADVLGDSQLEVLVPTNGEIAIFSNTGTQLTEDGSPPLADLLTFGTQTALSSVAVGDLENDNAKIEVIAVSAEPFPTATDLVIHVWNPINRSSTPPWGMFRQSTDRLGVVPGTPSQACMAQGELPQDFFTVTPCRLVDTRDPDGPLGGPSLVSDQQRIFTVAGSCGVPTTAKAISANVTVVTPSGGGHIQVFPADQSEPATSVINFGPGQIRANNAVIFLSTNAVNPGVGKLRAVVKIPGGGVAHMLLDINGYFQPP